MRSLKGFMLCAVMLAALVGLRAQTPEWLWAVGAGGIGEDSGYDITIDSAGNLYVTGYYFETSNFGPFTLVSSGGADIFAAKIDTSGNFIWAVSAGGTSGDYGREIAVDGAGNIYLNGYFNGTATFGPHTLNSAGLDDIFTAKLDPQGNFIWAVRGGGIYSDIGFGIAVSYDGEAYVTGYYQGNANFGIYNLNSFGQSDIFVAKLDSSGNFLWAVSAGGSASELGYSIAVDSIGNAFLNGTFSGTSVFGLFNLTSSGIYDVFTTKLDPSGNFLWAVSAGGSSNDYGQGIAVDGVGNIYLTGYFTETANFGSITINSIGGSDIFAAKLDSSGNFIWAVGGGGSVGDEGRGITVDNAGNAYLTGDFKGVAYFGSFNITSNGSHDLFTAKLDTMGNWLWVAEAGGVINDYGHSIAVGGTGIVNLTGSFTGTASFGANNLISSGNTDVFISKLFIPINASFTADITYGIEPISVQFTDESTPGPVPITNWFWTFGDGGSSTEQNPSHTYIDPGVYSVFLTVVDQNFQTSTKVRQNYITVIERVQAVELLSTETLNFGSVYLEEQSAWQSVVFSNTGNVGLTISALHFSSDPLHFEFINPFRPLVLSPGAIDSILVRFAPQAVGNLFDTFCIENDSYNLPVITIALAGSGEYVPPLPPGNVDLVMDGINAVITWEPVTQNTHNQPLTPDYYLIFYNGLPDPEAPYYYLGWSSGLSYTHERVGLHAQYMFYHVIAYKYYGRSSLDFSILKPGMSEEETTKILSYLYRDNSQ
jgi:PKD repeat protein